MRLLIPAVSLFLLSHCGPAHPPSSQVASPPSPPQAIPLPQTDPSPLEPARVTRLSTRSLTLEGLAFDSRSHRIQVVDQPAGPGSRFADAAAVGTFLNALAVSNACFFTPEGLPLGCVITNGNRTGSWNEASSLCSGVWHEDNSGRSAISRRSSLGKPRAMSMRELIQAGPLLVENGHTITGLDASKSSVRTLLLWDGTNRWWLGRSSPCTLAEAATALIEFRPGGWPVAFALNLDGGRSSDLWVSDGAHGGPLLRRSPWNRPVRNFLAVTRR